MLYKHIKDSHYSIPLQLVLAFTLFPEIGHHLVHSQRSFRDHSNPGLYSTYRRYTYTLTFPPRGHVGGRATCRYLQFLCDCTYSVASISASPALTLAIASRSAWSAVEMSLLTSARASSVNSSASPERSQTE